MNDLHGQAIFDYYLDQVKSPLLLHNSYGEPEEMPVEVFFREPEDFSELENLAISHCYGKILDLGAGAGAHSLLMQALEIDYTALDNSPLCCETMRKSGLNHVIEEDFKKHEGKYDTIFLLMNGIGLAGTLENLPAFLATCEHNLNEGGQIIFDSSDINYLYADGLDKPKHYYGEIKYRYEYAGNIGEWFDWLYVDADTLKQVIEKSGWHLETLMTDENDQYLGRLTKL